MINGSKTNLETQISWIIYYIRKFFDYNLNTLSLYLLSLLLGFFISTALSTIPAQTGDWSIIASVIIVTNQEIISKVTYHKKTDLYRQNNKTIHTCFKYCNSVKIGILYGLFVDAFKLGS